MLTKRLQNVEQPSQGSLETAWTMSCPQTECEACSMGETTYWHNCTQVPIRGTTVVSV